MNLFRSIAAVIGTLGVALAAGTLFQSADSTQQLGGTSSGSLPEGDSASLIGPFSDASDGLPLSLSVPMPPTAAPPDLARPVSTDHEEETQEHASLEPAAGQPEGDKASNPMASPIASLRRVARAMGQMPDFPPAARDALGGVETNMAEAGEDTADAANEDLLASADIEAAMEDCAIWLVVTPEPQSMLDLSLYAPCDGGARVEIGHEGMQISETLSDDGQLMLTLPALAREARVTLEMADGRRAEDATEIHDIDLTERLVLSWQGADALALNAHVGGAAHGESGHVHPAQTHSPGQGAQYGFLTTLGDPALEDAALAQVYTFPAALGADADAVDLAVEAAITEKSCGQRVNAQTRLIRAGRATAPRQMSLTMPECDGFEGFLLIDGLIPDLTLAQN